MTIATRIPRCPAVRRRRFLALTAGLVVAGLGCRSGSRSEEETAAAWLQQSDDAREALVAVGAAYLGGQPDRPSAAGLAAEVFGGWSTEDLALRNRRLRRRVSAQVQADFAAGRTVGVAGWVLSRTEVRLAALAALHRSEPGRC